MNDAVQWNREVHTDSAPRALKATTAAPPWRSMAAVKARVVARRWVFKNVHVVEIFIVERFSVRKKCSLELSL